MCCHLLPTQTLRVEHLVLSQLGTTFVEVNSRLSAERKECALWDIAVELSPRWTGTLLLWQIMPDFFVETQLSQYRNDSFIVFEASKAQYGPDIAPDSTQPYFLTNNLDLWRKEFNSQAKQDVVEAAINRHGFDHLIDVVLVSQLSLDV